jgi:signal transduction histidine kinase
MAQRERILVVDDEPLNRELLVGFLGGDYEVIEAANGPAALGLFDQNIDLVLLDIAMPGMDGYAVCERIKQATKEQYLPVIFLSALSAHEERIRGLRAGGDDFLLKPFDGVELRLRISAFLRLRRQAAIIQSQVQQLLVLDSFKDDLTSLLLHDLRAPLAVIFANLSLLRAELSPRGGEALEDLDAALTSAQRLRTGLDELLRIRLLEEGELRLDPTPFLVAPVIQEAAQSVQHAATQRSIELCRLVPDQLTIVADRSLLLRSLENLLGNALKYSPPDSSIEISAQRRGPATLLSVADRGPGIADEFKERVFEKFGSVEAARQQGRRGFGLGLYLVRLVMAAHGGKGQVSDRPGGGSVFTLAFPDAAPEATAEASTNPPAPG